MLRVQSGGGGLKVEEEEREKVDGLSRDLGIQRDAPGRTTSLRRSLSGER